MSSEHNGSSQNDHAFLQLKQLQSSWRQAPPVPNLGDYLTDAVVSNPNQVMALVQCDVEERLRVTSLAAFEQEDTSISIEHYEQFVGAIKPTSNLARLVIYFEFRQAASLGPQQLQQTIAHRSTQFAEDVARVLEDLGHNATTQEASPDPTKIQSEQAKGRTDADGYYRYAYDVGQMIGQYKLRHPLGHGGFGEVWLAEQHEPDLKVALKLIRADKVDKQSLARFEAEQQTLALLQHDNIAKIFNSGFTDDGLPYFAMEYVQGEKLTDYCDRHCLSIEERLDVFARICDAVHHAHMQGLIHRDLSPDNILVSIDQKEQPNPKIIDFGVAKAVNPNLVLTERTLSLEFNTMIGKLEYMSPEQAEAGKVGIDTRTDIFALGVILYELLSGVLPLTGKELEDRAIDELLAIIRFQSRPDPATKFWKLDEESRSATAHARGERDTSEIIKLLSGRVRHLPMTAMRHDRTKRFTSAAAMAQDIRNYLSDRPFAEAAAESKWDRAKLIVRRNPAPYIAAALVFFTLLAGIVGTSIGIVRALDAEEKAVKSDGAKSIALREKDEALGLLQISIENEKAARQDAVDAAQDAEKARKEEEAQRKSADRRRQEAEAATTLAKLRLQERDEALASERTARIAAQNRAIVANAHAVMGDNPALALALLAELPADAKNGAGAIALAKQLGSVVQPVLRGSLASGAKSLEFSPDGKYVVATCFNSKVYLFDATGADPPVIIEGDRRTFVRATVSADGTLLAAGDFDGSVQVWKLESQELLYRFVDHTKEITSLSFSRDCMALLSTSQDGTARAYWLGQEEHTRYSHGTAEVLDGQINSDGTRVLTLAGEGPPSDMGFVDLDVAAQARLWVRDGDGFYSTDLDVDAEPEVWLSFLSNGSRVAVASQSGAIGIWDVENLDRPERVIHPRAARPRSISVSPEETSVAISYFDDSSFLVASLAGEQAITRAQVFANSSGSMPIELSFLASHDRLAVRIGGLVSVWELVPRSDDGDSSQHWWPRASLLDNDLLRASSHMAIHPTLERIAVNQSMTNIYAWHVAPDNLRELTEVFGPLGGMDVSQNISGDVLSMIPTHPRLGRPFAMIRSQIPSTAANHSLIHLHYFDEQHFRRTSSTSGNPTDRIFRLANETILARAYTGSHATLWNLESSQSKFIEMPGGAELYDFATDVKGSVLLFATSKGLLRQSAVDDPTMQSLHDGAVFSIAVSPILPYLVERPDEPDNTIRLWNWSTGELLDSNDSVYLPDLRFTGDGRYVIGAGRNGDIQVWSLADNALASVYTETFRGEPEVIATSETGSVFSVGFDDGQVIVIDARNPEKTLRVFAGPNQVEYLDISPDEKRISACFDDGSAQIWSRENAADHITFDSGNMLRWIVAIQFTEDSEHVVVAASAGTVQILPISWKTLHPIIARLTKTIGLDPTERMKFLSESSEEATTRSTQGAGQFDND